ncbi:MAG: hypothetical protein JW708_01760 [Vallitaleaceae bacterium]|nr:hypothetical protein [Vallitaleaceae bacterium]
MKNNEELKNLALRIAHFIGQVDEEAETYQEGIKEENYGFEKKVENIAKNR